MSAGNDGGPAFPRPASEGHHAHDGEHLHGYGEQSGMSLRQAYKIAALQGVLMHPNCRDDSHRKIALQCGAFADALLAEDAAFAARTTKATS
jgi:hypothetical protein